LKPKILILTPRVPFPLRDGGAIAMSQTIEEYIKLGCEVSLLSMNTSRHWVDENDLPAFYHLLKNFKTVFLKTDVQPLSAFLNLFTGKSYNIERFIHKGFKAALEEIITNNNFDFIQFESIYVAPYLSIAKKLTEAKLFCRVHNIEYLIWQRLAENETSFLKKKYLRLLTNRLKKYELAIIQKFDLLLTISSKEAHFFQSQELNRCYYLPFGIDTNQHITKHQEIFSLLSCYHVGSMDWSPNVEGVQWLIKEVWPLVIKKKPNAKLFLAGKNMPLHITIQGNENIIVLGEVDDITNFSISKNIMLVPLLSGAGIRVKVLEAMSFGKTIISTSIGVEGIGLQHQKEIFLADTANDFAEQILYCFECPSQAKQIGQVAHDFVKNKFNKQLIYKNWLLFYAEVFQS
jgi:polysaccharide biosynthesis protein PslH